MPGKHNVVADALSCHPDLAVASVKQHTRIAPSQLRLSWTCRVGMTYSQDCDVRSKQRPKRVGLKLHIRQK